MKFFRLCGRIDFLCESLVSALSFSAIMIPAKTRLQYAKGYLELGMINEASEEIDHIMGEDRMNMPVMVLRMK